MGLSELCKHLELLTDKLTEVGSGQHYKVGRICQNLRLDFPCMRDSASGEFLDSKPYPNAYPLNRGPNVTAAREKIFQEKLQAGMAEFKQIVTSAESRDFPTVVGASETYFKKLASLWADEEYLTTANDCNAENCAANTALPQTLCRYINLKTFIRYVLVPNATDRKYRIKDNVDAFLQGLAEERNEPGTNWRELANLWKEVRQKIRAGGFHLSVKPKYGRGDINFIGDGRTPIHLDSPHPARSQETLHYVVRQLALPGWERPNDQINNLGLVAVEVASISLCAYRPTILDNLGSYSYFFLPGQIAKPSGLTWRLTDCLCFNSPDHFDGQAEWTVMVPPQGIPCVITQNSNPMPAFQIAALAFGPNHASLFEE